MRKRRAKGENKVLLPAGLCVLMLLLRATLASAAAVTDMEINPKMIGLQISQLDFCLPSD